jgi:hypothetical protein
MPDGERFDDHAPAVCACNARTPSAIARTERNSAARLAGHAHAEALLDLEDQLDRRQRVDPQLVEPRVRLQPRQEAA